MILAPFLRQRYFDSNGNPLAGGKLYFYQAGTTTPQATYTDSTGGTPNANPVILDANGEANVWLDAALSYKAVLKDSSDVTQWTVDNVGDPNATKSPTWNANVTYSQGDIVADTGGFGLLYVSLINNNTNNALTSVSSWRIFNGRVRTLSANTSLSVNDDVVLSDSTLGNLTMTLPACASTPVGKKIIFKDIGTGGFTTSIKGSGTDPVDGNNTYANSLQSGNSATAQNDGAAWRILTRDSLIVPTVQKFTSGSGTYTLPTSPRKPAYLKVKMVGGGGGGGGSGTTSPGSGGNGGNTTFGTSLLTANGGTGGNSGNQPPQAGGTATIAAPAYGTAINGATGNGSGFQNVASQTQVGGSPGGSSPFGGAGGGGEYSTAGADAASNSGSGGGGAGSHNQSTSISGQGGAAGGYIEAIIPSPSATYSYAVGAAGSAGSAGGGSAGGAGGSGYIIVEEHYQ